MASVQPLTGAAVPSQASLGFVFVELLWELDWWELLQVSIDPGEH